MGYSPTDHMIEWLYDAEIFHYEADEEYSNNDPWNPDGEEHSDQEPLTPYEYERDADYCDYIKFDPRAVEKEIDRHWIAQKRLKDEGALRSTSSHYYVFYDGRWHCDLIQTWAIFDDSAYLDPWDWIQASVRLERENFLKAKDKLLKAMDGNAAVGEGTEKWNVFAVRGQKNREDVEKWLEQKKYRWFGYEIQYEWIGKVSTF